MQMFVETKHGPFHPAFFLRCQLLVMVIFLRCQLLLASRSIGANKGQPDTALTWEFQTFSSQPDNGYLSSLLLTNPSQGKVVAFENNAANPSSQGTTWEASTKHGSPSIKKGGQLLWSKETTLNRSPESRTYTDTAIISWDLDKENVGGQHGVVLFGGRGGTTGNQVLGDTWIYRTTTGGVIWYDETNAGNSRVPPRYGHTLANVGFDTSYIVMFGGCNGTHVQGDTWLMKAAAYGDLPVSLSWVNVGNASLTEQQPGPRYHHAMSSYTSTSTTFSGLNPAENKVILKAVMFGGCGNIHGTDLLSDTWVYTIDTSDCSREICGTWKQIISKEIARPSRRKFHSMAYLGPKAGTQSDGVVLMYGGQCIAHHGKIATCNDKVDGTTFEFSTSTGWTKILPPKQQNDETAWPIPKYGTSMATLAHNGDVTLPQFTVLMLAGTSGEDGSKSAETWSYGISEKTSTRTWVQHKPATTPAYRAMSGLAQIPGTEKALLFGGSLKTPNAKGCPNSLVNSTWVYDGTKKGINSFDEWDEIFFYNASGKTVMPTARHWHAMSGLSKNKVLLFGGMGGCTSTRDTKLLNDTWIYDSTNTVQQKWTKVQSHTHNSSVLGRQYHAVAQLNEGLVVMFGGVTAVAQTNSFQLAKGTDLFTETSNQWTKIDVGATLGPQPRVNHAMAQLNDGTVLLFGGADALPFSDSKGNGTRNYLQDIWILRKSNDPGIDNPSYTWKEITTGSTNALDLSERLGRPQGRMAHAMSSMGKDKVLLFGGCVGDRFHSSCVTFLDDLWLFNRRVGNFIFEVFEWIPIRPLVGTACGVGPGLRAKHSMAWIGSHVLLFGGQINEIQGSTRDINFAGDTWLIGDGCPTGYHLPTGSQIGGCQICGYGLYSSNRSASACDTCPAGLTTATQGNDDHEDCRLCRNDHFYGKCSASCSTDPKTNIQTCKADWICNPWAYGNHCQNKCPGTILNPNWKFPEPDRDKYFACHKQGSCGSDGNCQCNTRYAGDGCEIDCGVNSNTDATANNTCVCNPTYFGTKCDLQCKNGGTPAFLPLDPNDNSTEAKVAHCNCPIFFGKFIGTHSNCGFSLLMPLVLLFLVLGFFGFGCVFRRSWKKDMRVAQHRNEAERSLLERNWQQDVTMLSEGRRIDGDDIEFGAKLAEGQFGEVWKGTWIALPDQWVAIKKIKFTGEEILQHQQQQQQGEQKEYLDKKDAAKKRLLTNKTASLGSRASFSRVLSKNTRGHNRGSKSESDASKFMSTVDSLFLDQQDTSWIDQEIKLLLRVKPHVRTVLFHGAGRLATGEIFLVTEFMSNGDLCSALKPCDPTTNEPLLSWEKRIQIAADIAEGMEFLHSRQPPLIHRDLKSANVLLSSDCRAKIADFGLSRFAEEREEQAATLRRSFAAGDGHDESQFDLLKVDMTGRAGTFLWMAPEIMDLQKNVKALSYGLPVDVYSFAIVLFELTTCKFPWMEVKFCHQIQDRIAEGKRPLMTQKEIDAATDNHGEIMIEWMKKCWAHDPKERPTFAEALKGFRKVESVHSVYVQDVRERKARRRGSALSSHSVGIGEDNPLAGSASYAPPGYMFTPSVPSSATTSGTNSKGKKDQRKRVSSFNVATSKRTRDTGRGRGESASFNTLW